MLIKIYFFITIISNISCSLRLPRSALREPISEYNKEKNKYNIAWADWNGGHDSGYQIKKDGHHEKDLTNFKHAIKEEGEKHALKSATGAGKHALATVEKGASKHLDHASALGKDVKAKTFGFFDYQYKQPEYHVEQFYTDEKHRQKVGTDRLHHTSKDHKSDAHQASGWGKHGKGYHNDAKGLVAHENGGEFHDGWANNFQKGYEHEGEKDYSKGHDIHKGHYHHDTSPPHLPNHHNHHHHHGNHDTPYEHSYGHGSGMWDYPAEYDVWGKWRHGWEHGLD